MENQFDREQPSLEQANVLNATEDKSADSGAGSLGYGKFKSAEALYEGYKALEAEFTRKSQKLSELEKEKAEQATQSQQNADSELASFLSSREEAKAYAGKITEMAQASQGKMDYESLLAKAMVDSLAEGQNKLENPIIKKYVLEDEQLAQSVILSYMKKLSQGQPPYTISGDKGEKVAGSVPATPKSLSEAKKMVEDLFS